METPILFIIFNRPDTTARVFEEIRKARPKQLFIAADGPRDGNKNDKIFCEEAKNITKNVDWECEVKTLSRNNNLGCKIAVSSAINWFFQNVEGGIILEDDCLPDPSFFTFCEAMLEKYKDNEKIGMITGDNFIQKKILKNINPNKDEYYLIRPIYIWGWATWKRAWRKYDIEMKNWPNIKKQKCINKMFKNKNVSLFFNDSFDLGHSDRSTTWDVQWFFSCLINNMLCIIPPRNLISNIGVVGTHSKTRSPFNNMPTESFSVENLRHPENISPNIEIENIIFNNTYIDRFSYRIFLINILDFLKIKGVIGTIYRKLNFKF